MDYKNRILKTVAANSSENIILDTATNGWISNVHLHFPSAATGDIGLSVKRGGVWAGIATATLSADGEAVWTGNTYTEPGDTLKISNQTSVDASAWILMGYELSGTGAWQTIKPGVTEESSSSSSNSSSSYERMVITVQSDAFGITNISNDDQFTLALRSGETYDFTAYYDGTSTAHSTDSDLTLTFPSGNGTYDIEIAGTFAGFHFNNTDDKLKIKEIKNWGDSEVSPTSHSMYSAYQGCTNLTISATDDLGSENITTMASAFYNCPAMTSFPLIDVGSVTSFADTWRSCTGLTSFPALVMSSASTLVSTWRLCTGMTSFGVTNIGTASDLRATWHSCSGLTSFPLVDTSSATNVAEAWRGLTSISTFPTLNLSSMTNGNSAFLGTTLSTASYSDLLVSIESLNSDPDAIFHGGNSTYNSAGGVARTALEGRDPGWTIVDGGGA